MYREIKLELADAMMSGFPRKLSVRHRFERVWNGYVQWGVANPGLVRALAGAYRPKTRHLTPATRRNPNVPFCKSLRIVVRSWPKMPIR